MLEKLDDINWHELKHAYGSAEDVPSQIRSLLASDSQTREKALWALSGNIFHQGTRYQATPYAIPFLYELIESEKTPDRDKIILFLISLALGYEEEYLPEGVNILNFRNEYKEAEKNLTSAQREECSKYGYSPQAILDGYDQVKAGIPILLELVDHSDKKIRRAAMYALAWFPETASVTISRIKNQLTSFSEEEDILIAILAIGLLVRSSQQAFDISDLEKYLTSQSSLIRISAAIGLAQHPLSDKILTELINGILSNKEFNYLENIPFNEGRLAGYASLVLSKYGSSEKQKVIPTLCEVLKSVNAYQSLDVTAGLLGILNGNRTKLIKDTDVNDLDDLDRMALHTILHYGGWELGNADYVNFSELLQYAGVPDTREKLKNYLADQSKVEYSLDKEENQPRTVLKAAMNFIRRLLGFH